MGTGITTRSGAAPLAVWRNRIDNFDSPELSAALRTLLGGEPLTSRDGVVEVSAAPDGAPGRHRLTVRIPAAPYVADLVGSALEPAQCPDPDDRYSSPSPDKWITQPARGAVLVWELFNCRIHTLTSRRN